MLFKACAEGEYEPGKTYYGRGAERVHANALGCIERGLTALVEVRLEGVAGENMAVVRVFTAKERCAEWTGVYAREDAIQLWFRDGQLHREEGPATVYPNGDQWWYRDGQLHREGDLLAVIYANGRQMWYRDGQLHREPGPAVVSDGCHAWYRNGKAHREDGAAVVYGDGTLLWYLNDVRIFGRPAHRRLLNFAC